MVARLTGTNLGDGLHIGLDGDTFCVFKGDTELVRGCYIVLALKTGFSCDNLILCVVRKFDRKV